MHLKTKQQLQHEHDFTLIHEKGETRTTIVLGLTAVTMIVEIIAGTVFGSMALLADGWHMGTHAAAFGLTLFTYRYSRKHASDPRFAFGTGKVAVLGGFASAVGLMVVALVMIVESIVRIINPHDIRFTEAIVVAVLGLLVNMVSAVLLKDDHHHDPGGNESHYDHNLRGAYFHVLADALTSVLAIAALMFVKYFGWNRFDPIVGILGAILIAKWAYGLIKDTSGVLLDKTIDGETLAAIKQTVESDSDNRLSDIHIWKVGPADYAAVLSLITHYPKPPAYYKDLLIDFKDLSHITVEINPCIEYQYEDRD